MSRNHDPFRCPQCRSTRTRSMQLVAMAGTRHGNARASRATIGARGWWNVSGTRARWISQTTLARRYAPTETISSGGLVALLLLGACIHGATGAFLAVVLGLFLQLMLSRDPPDGFVCLRCGLEFKPTESP